MGSAVRYRVLTVRHRHLMDRVKFDMFCDWLTANCKDITADNWQLRLLEFELGYRA